MNLRVRVKEVYETGLIPYPLWTVALSHGDPAAAQAAVPAGESLLWSQ